MEDFGILLKLIRLVKMTLDDTQAKVNVKKKTLLNPSQITK